MQWGASQRLMYPFRTLSARGDGRFLKDSVLFASIRVDSRFNSLFLFAVNL